MDGSIKPISILEIESYTRIMRVDFRPYEVDILVSLDNEYLKVVSDGLGESSN
jgi:hypothetical protein